MQLVICTQGRIDVCALTLLTTGHRPVGFMPAFEGLVIYLFVARQLIVGVQRRVLPSVHSFLMSSCTVLYSSTVLMLSCSLLSVTPCSEAIESL